LRFTEKFSFSTFSGGFMMPNDFANDKGKKFFRKLWIKFSGRRKVAETRDLRLWRRHQLV
jgi:hypothetical protein